MTGSKGHVDEARVLPELWRSRMLVLDPETVTRQVPAAAGPLVPVTNAIAGIDLAGGKQMVVVTDHDSKVVARRTFRCRAWDLGSALDWPAGRAAAPTVSR